jgi:hypothetical protein
MPGLESVAKAAKAAEAAEAAYLQAREALYVARTTFVAAEESYGRALHTMAEARRALRAAYAGEAQGSRRSVVASSPELPHAVQDDS